MPRFVEHQPGDPAPMTGTYEMLSVFGTATGVRREVAAGESLPPAPLRHSWVFVDPNEPFE
ncbi:MAG TPA: hypothetical protein VME92_02855 [Acetobacteraceae bacterium]|nr:hypothetical protein [Acetobacteraceae bacterium]